MQDLDQGPRVGRRRLSAVPGERATPAMSRNREPVVPATRLLEVASALSDGASKLHAQLRHLEPEERDALLDAVTDQVTVILGLWADLVRGVVSSDEAVPAAGTQDHRRQGDERERRGRRPGSPDRDAETGEVPVRDRPLREGRWSEPALCERQTRTTVADESSARPAGEDDTFVRDSVGRDLGASASPEPLDEQRGLARQRQRAQERALDEHPARLPAGAAPAVAPPVRRRPVERPRDADRLSRDELTGVLNRQAGFSALEREIDRCRRGGERFVLGYLNVDGMKAVNEARGTRAGDELLRKVTAALRATLRSYDVIARLGGDEFLFSMPGADVATADLRFKEFAVILTEEAPGSSASVGFAELHHQDTLDDLVMSAETAMLKARRTRRRGRG
jgi:diguanylate cyclase (GGDEF)-like protein